MLLLQVKEFRWKNHLDRLADPEREKKLSKDERAESRECSRFLVNWSG